MYILNMFDVCFVELFSKERHTTEYNSKHYIKSKNEFFSAKSLKFSEFQMGHLHTCPLHFKLMPTTSLLHILHNEETRDNKFGYIFYSQQKKIKSS